MLDLQLKRAQCKVLTLAVAMFFVFNTWTNQNLFVSVRARQALPLAKRGGLKGKRKVMPLMAVLPRNGLVVDAFAFSLSTSIVHCVCGSCYSHARGGNQFLPCWLSRLRLAHFGCLPVPPALFFSSPSFAFDQDCA